MAKATIAPMMNEPKSNLMVSFLAEGAATRALRITRAPNSFAVAAAGRVIGLAQLLQDMRRNTHFARAAQTVFHLDDDHAAFAPPQLIIRC